MDVKRNSVYITIKTQMHSFSLYIEYVYLFFYTK